MIRHPPRSPLFPYPTLFRSMLPPSGPQVPVDLAGELNSDGVTSEFYLGDGDFDGAGNTYPAAQLPQTGQLTDDGVPFLFVNGADRKSTRLNSSHLVISYAVF